MKSIDDYVDDIEDVLSQECECRHSQDWDEFNTYDVAEYSLREKGRLGIHAILLQMREADYDNFMEVVSKVAEEKHERENNETANTG